MKEKWLNKWDWGLILMLLVAPLIILGIGIWALLGLFDFIEFHTGLAIVIGLFGLACIPIGNMISINQKRAF